MDSSYSSLIAPPKYSDTNVNQNMTEISEYQKILKGEQSRKMPNTDLPIGQIYTYDTGSMCTDAKTGLPTPRHTVINVRKSKGLLGSAYADFDTAKMDPYIDVDAGVGSDKCMQVNVKEVDKNGKQTINKQRNITIAEYKRSSPDLFVEGFISPGLVDDKVTSTNYMKHMDAGQRFFVGTVAVLGLYMYHQLLFGKRT